MSDQIISLRTESVEAQKMRFDLAKFKLISTAILGSIAVGAGSTAGTEKFPYVMGLVPLVCIYIDLIADSKQIQILVIGSFLKNQKSGIFVEYEKFCSDLRSKKNVFIDSYAFYFSTIFLCITIFIFGLGQLVFMKNVDISVVLINILSGFIGFCLSIIIKRHSKVRTQLLE